MSIECYNNAYDAEGHFIHIKLLFIKPAFIQHQVFGIYTEYIY